MSNVKKDARIIAIDGPSGSGKSSVSKRVGAALGFLHVDSGALYRIMTWQCLKRLGDTSNPQEIDAISRQVSVDFIPKDGAVTYHVDGEEPGDVLRTPEINRHASTVATVKGVRDQITTWLREMTRFGDLIVEGRDITTAVVPETPARFYLEASAEARAERRRKEEIEKGIAQQSAEEVKASLLARDKIDSSRKYAPLKKADGVTVIDSTHLTLDEVVQTVMDALPSAWKQPRA